MITKKLTEEKFNQLLPLLYEAYPKTKDNQPKINEVVKLYKETSFCDNTIVGLVDVSKRSFVYLSDNVNQLGYSKTALVGRGILNPFTVIHNSHHSFPFKYLKLQNNFLENISKDHINSKSYFCGVKLLDKKRENRRLFIKTKTLLVDEKNNATLIVCFIEDITHLIKNDAYWLRIQNGNKSAAYVQQRGKKEFKDVISKKEKEALLLMAKHKSNIEIANELFVSISTVESHRKNMIKRLGAASSGALVHLCKMAHII
ncbi:MAG: response regulator transcription factor [Saprospiraceae bacterium]